MNRIRAVKCLVIIYAYTCAIWTNQMSTFLGEKNFSWIYDIHNFSDYSWESVLKRYQLKFTNETKLNVYWLEIANTKYNVFWIDIENHFFFFDMPYKKINNKM